MIFFNEGSCGGRKLFEKSFPSPAPFFIFATFLKKGGAKNFHTGKFLTHTLRSTIIDIYAIGV